MCSCNVLNKVGFCKWDLILMTLGGLQQERGDKSFYKPNNHYVRIARDVLYPLGPDPGDLHL